MLRQLMRQEVHDLLDRRTRSTLESQRRDFRYEFRNPVWVRIKQAVPRAVFELLQIAYSLVTWRGLERYRHLAARS